MKEITQEMWNNALENLEVMRDMAKELGWTGIFYVNGCNSLKKRYDNGERTEELYNEMMDLH